MNVWTRTDVIKRVSICMVVFNALAYLGTSGCQAEQPVLSAVRQYAFCVISNSSSTICFKSMDIACYYFFVYFAELRMY